MQVHLKKLTTRALSRPEILEPNPWHCVVHLGSPSVLETKMYKPVGQL